MKDIKRRMYEQNLAIKKLFTKEDEVTYAKFRAGERESFVSYRVRRHESRVERETFLKDCKDLMRVRMEPNRDRVKRDDD